MEWKVESPYKDWGGESYNAGARDQAKKLVEWLHPRVEAVSKAGDYTDVAWEFLNFWNCWQELRRQVGL